ncbi:hypothetical protein WJX79_008745 [Trebouxia sp. C0005]
MANLLVSYSHRDVIHLWKAGKRALTHQAISYPSSAHNGCRNLTDCIAFIYDYLIIELQLEPCGNINSPYLAAKNSNISGGGITAEGPVHTDGLLTSAVAGL